MQQFLLLIYKQDENIAPLSGEKDMEFLKSCESYIEKLIEAGKLKSAQPIQQGGMIVSGIKGNLKAERFPKSEIVNGGYYHIVANDINDAVAIAKENPEFEYGTRVKIEVHPIKGEEESTGYEYPK